MIRRHPISEAVAIILVAPILGILWGLSLLIYGMAMLAGYAVCSVWQRWVVK
jgi:hypothetical protein